MAYKFRVPPGEEGNMREVEERPPVCAVCAELCLSNDVEGDGLYAAGKMSELDFLSRSLSLFRTMCLTTTRKLANEAFRCTYGLKGSTFGRSYGMTTTFGKIGAIASYHEHRKRLLLHRALESLLSLLCKYSCKDMDEYAAMTFEALAFVSNLVSEDVYMDPDVVDEMLLARGHSNEVRTSSTYKKKCLLNDISSVLTILNVSVVRKSLILDLL